MIPRASETVGHHAFPGHLTNRGVRIINHGVV